MYYIKNNKDIVLISKTKLKPIDKLRITNFITYRSDYIRPGAPASGGTAILIHRRIIHQHVNLNTKMSFASLEISTANEEIRISAIYKRPGLTLDIDDLEVLTSGCDLFIVAGDIMQITYYGTVIRQTLLGKFSSTT